jgi:flagellar motor switch protein FliN/FliY
LAPAVGDALAAGAAEVARTAGADISPGTALEADADQLLAAGGGESLLYPLLEGTERVAALVVATTTGGFDAGDSGTPTAVAVHEFQPLDASMSLGHADSRPLSLLADVEMGVTAELGRRRMTVRDLLSLTPGAVIELDRAAGTPVDVLVNGTLIARGEVVVIDEEFGIRVSEIVAADAAAR